MSPSLSPDSPATLSDRLDRIFELIHDGTPDDVRLADVMAPFSDPDDPQPGDESTATICWIPAMDVKFDVLADLEGNVVRALRQLASEIGAAADRVEEGCR